MMIEIITGIAVFLLATRLMIFLKDSHYKSKYPYDKKYHKKNDD